MVAAVITTGSIRVVVAVAIAVVLKQPPAAVVKASWLQEYPYEAIKSHLAPKTASMEEPVQRIEDHPYQQEVVE